MFRKVSFATITSLLTVGWGRMGWRFSLPYKPLGHSSPGAELMGFESPSPVPDVGSARDPASLC